MKRSMARLLRTSVLFSTTTALIMLRTMSGRSKVMREVKIRHKNAKMMLFV